MRSYLFVLFFLFSSVASATNIYSSVEFVDWSTAEPPVELFDVDWETPQAFSGPNNFVEWQISNPVWHGETKFVLSETSSPSSVTLYIDGNLRWVANRWGEWGEWSSWYSWMQMENGYPTLTIQLGFEEIGQTFRAEFNSWGDFEIVQILGNGRFIHNPEPGGFTIMLLLTCWFILRR